jgi:hypothetical protein
MLVINNPTGHLEMLTWPGATDVQMGAVRT